MSNFLHIEGMDLSGKTTLARNYADSSGLIWKIQSNSLSENNPIWDLAERLRKGDEYDEEIVGNVYLAALMADIRSFKIDANTNIVQDSTIALRSLAYHTVRGTPRILKEIERLLDEHPRPDKTIYLAADMSARVSRLRKRQNENPSEVAADDLMILSNPERFIQTEMVLRELSVKIFGAVIIDTTDLSEQQVLEKVQSEYKPEVAS